jgi:mycothiol synthase
MRRDQGPVRAGRALSPSGDPPAPGGALRAPAREDVPAIVELAVAVDRAEYGVPDFTEDDVLSEWAVPRFDVARDAWVSDGPAGGLTGYASVQEKQPGREYTGTLLCLHANSAADVGARLLRAVEHRARERLRLAGSPRARLAWVIPSVSAVREALLRGAGYRHTRTYVRMDIDLEGRAVALRDPPGLKIRVYRPGVDDRALHAVIEESFADHFRHVTEPHEEWMALRTADPRFAPDLWFVAWDGEEPAGGIIGYDLGDISWIRELGVRPRWRRRGLGMALLLRSFAAFKARGREKICLGVDAENAYDATRLYRRAGMAVGQTHHFWERTLTAD